MSEAFAIIDRNHYHRHVFHALESFQDADWINFRVRQIASAYGVSFNQNGLFHNYLQVLFSHPCPEGGDCEEAECLAKAGPNYSCCHCEHEMLKAFCVESATDPLMYSLIKLMGEIPTCKEFKKCKTLVSDPSDGMLRGF